MKTKTVKVLPKTTGEIQNGGVYRQRVRCGKSSCRCAGGGSNDRHTAFYFFTRRAGKLVKFYIPKAEVENFTGIANQAAVIRRHERQAVKLSADLLVKLRIALSENARLLDLLRSDKNYE